MLPASVDATPATGAPVPFPPPQADITPAARSPTQAPMGPIVTGFLLIAMSQTKVEIDEGGLERPRL